MLRSRFKAKISDPPYSLPRHFGNDQADNIVNFAAHEGMGDGGARGNGRFLAGVGVSIAVHVLLMFAYRHSGPALPAFEPEPEPLVVSIRPLPPPVPPRVEEATPAPVAQAKPTRSTRKSTAKRVIAVPETTEPPSPDAFVVQQPQEPAPVADEAPKFDIDAAKQTARALAGQTKLGREGTALAQFPDPPLETETKAARAISKAKRRNCKDGLPGGLLAPLFLALDKKDSGCKW